MSAATESTNKVLNCHEDDYYTFLIRHRKELVDKIDAAITSGADITIQDFEKLRDINLDFLKALDAPLSSTENPIYKDFDNEADKLKACIEFFKESRKVALKYKHQN